MANGKRVNAVSEEETITAVDNDVRLQQEVFAWQVREDIWGGLIDAELRETLSQRFINDAESLEAAIVYVRDGQDKPREH